MSGPAIRIDGLGKKYRIGTNRRASYKTLREQVVETALRPWRRLRAVARGHSTFDRTSEIWALDNLDLEVEDGEVLGVIGHNGAGKTTLLKVLSRITTPTTGRVEIRGRVGALLEVGTGFHPELTGRENVFLNGAILGMGRKEITNKLDRIVDFAEVTDFIDTPVKFYSSGMSVRLAFAVAAHLEPEVLLIDEVLAVGDATFQRKCIASVRSSTQSGRTALVVSHNMAFVRSLCTRAVLLSRGRLVTDGTPDEVIAEYHRSTADRSAFVAPDSVKAKPIHVARVELLDQRGYPSQEIPCGEGLTVRLGLSLTPGASLPRPWIGVRILSWHGELICHLANREAGTELPVIEGPVTVVCEVPELNLLPGEYQIGVVVADVADGVQDRVEAAVPFTITPADVFDSGMVPASSHGTVFQESRWTLDDSVETAEVVL